MKKQALSQQSVKFDSRHGKHAIIKCHVIDCEYVGRSDNLKRHIAKKHAHENVLS